MSWSSVDKTYARLTCDLASLRTWTNCSCDFNWLVTLYRC